jgi:hypothetical protein
MRFLSFDIFKLFQSIWTCLNDIIIYEALDEFLRLNLKLWVAFILKTELE